MYEKLKEYGKTKRAFSVYKEGMYISVQYHDTVIALITDDDIILDNGGFFTSTTARHMNAILDICNVPATIYSKASKWVVTIDDMVKYPYPKHGTCVIPLHPVWLNMDDADLVMQADHHIACSMEICNIKTEIFPTMMAVMPDEKLFVTFGYASSYPWYFAGYNS